MTSLMTRECTLYFPINGASVSLLHNIMSSLSLSLSLSASSQPRSACRCMGVLTTGRSGIWSPSLHLTATVPSADRLMMTDRDRLNAHKNTPTTYTLMLLDDQLANGQLEEAVGCIAECLVWELTKRHKVFGWQNGNTLARISRNK